MKLRGQLGEGGDRNKKKEIDWSGDAGRKFRDG